jgi:hypothetical protein
MIPSVGMASVDSGIGRLEEQAERLNDCQAICHGSSLLNER